MPRMKQEPAFGLIQHIRSSFRQSGSRTAPYNAYDDLFTYIVRECSHPLSSVAGWGEPGLFVAFSDFKPTKKPFTMVIYQMGDDEIVALVIPSSTTKKMKGFTTYGSSPFFRGEEGLKVDHSHWMRVKMPKLVRV